MSDALRHRGPDGHGYFGWSPGRGGTTAQAATEISGAQTVLAHRRLAIIDLTDDAGQPMTDEDDRFTIVFNGEIYNYLEIREDLRALGRRFRTSSDTEVLLQAYAEWGADCLTRLTGMWAFAILDARTGDLFLARDPFGIKPLYYMCVGGSFVFASEVRALLTHPGAVRAINPTALHDYLRFGFTDRGGETMLADIHALPSAHFVRISPDAPTHIAPERYWELTPKPAGATMDEAAEALQALLRKNVDLHLRSDVPVAIALSGGLDSAAIVMTEQGMRRSAETHSFSYIADDPAIGEKKWIDILTAQSGVIAHDVHVDPQSLGKRLDEFVAAADEPFSTTSIFAQTRVFETVRDTGIKVILTGQGADEAFAGYMPFLSSRLRGLLGAGKFAAASRFIKNGSRNNTIPAKYLITRLLGQMAAGPMEAALRRLAGESVMPAWLSGDWFDSRGVQPRGVARNRSDAPLKDHLAHTMFDYTLPAILRHTDRTSMAQSIECRVPFLTTEMVTFAHSLADDLLIADNGTTKAVLRRAMRGIVPDQIIDRRDKVGFDTPQRKWMAANLPVWDTVLRSDAFRSIPAFNHAAAADAWHAMSDDPTRINLSLWRWVNLARWAEINDVSFA